MAASINDRFNKVISGTTRPVATTLSAQKLSGAVTASLTAATGWDTGTALHGIMYRTDAGTGAKVAGSQIDWKATLSGTTLSNFTVTAGTDDTYAIGTTVELAPTAAWGDDMATGLVVEHNQDGTHGAMTADSLTVDGTTTHTGAVAHNGGFTSKLSNEWVGGSGTWTYASASTFTVPAADAALMSVGTKIWLTQTTSKWFYVTGISGTTITVTAGSDYTVANAAITAPYFSNATTPVGFPDEFNWTPTWTNVSGGTNNYAIFSMVGKHVTFRIKYTLAGAGVSGAATFSTPVTAAANQSGDIALIGQGYFLDNGNNTYPGQLTFGSTTTMRIRPINAAGTYATAGAETSSTVPFTFGSSDVISAAGMFKAV